MNPKSIRQVISSHISLIIVIIIPFTGCQKYVDIKKNSAQFILEKAKDIQLLLDTYSIMNTGFPSDGQLSSDDFYLRGQSYSAANNRVEDIAVFQWSSSPRNLALPQWQTPYQIIYRANLALEAVEDIKSSGKDKSASNETLGALRGSGLFFRAYSFWNLAQIYAKPFDVTSALQDPGIPLRLTSDINEKSNRGTVQDTYGRIIKDLKEATTLLPATATIPSRPSKVAAYAMLARVYLSMEDYPNALESATAALQIKNDLLDYNLISQTQANPFTRFHKEVLFHSIILSIPLLSPGNQNSPIAIIDKDLASSYTNNDLRSKIFIKENFSPRIDPVTDDYIKNTSGAVQYFPDGTFRFSGNYEPSSSPTQFNGLAVDELYLIRAECFARANNTTQAMIELNTLLRTRWITNTYVDMVATSADEALTKVLTERRKELVMRSQRWTDLRRLNKDSRFAKNLRREIIYTPVPKTVTPAPIYYDLPIGDPRFTLLIPQEVISNSEIAQNPR